MRTQLESAIRLNRAQWPAHEMLAQVYDRQGKPDLATGEQFTAAINVRPQMAALYRARALVELRRKHQDASGRARAIGDLETAIRLERPGSSFLPSDQTNRAQLLHREGREDEALLACAAALELDPGFLDAHLLRIDVLRRLKRHSEVIRSCDAVLTQGKPSAELYELRALAKQDLKDYEGAIEDNTLAHALRPRSAAILAQRGRALPDYRRSPRMALRDFEEAIKLDPASAASADSYLGRGLARATLGMHREAAADASRAVRLGKRTDERLYRRWRLGFTRKPRARRGSMSRSRGRRPCFWCRATRIKRLSYCVRQSRWCRSLSGRVLCVMLSRPTRRSPQFGIAFGFWTWPDQPFHRTARNLNLHSEQRCLVQETRTASEPA